MPKSFLLKRKVDDIFVLGNGLGIRRQRQSSENDDVYSDHGCFCEERTHRLLDVKMIPKSLKTLRLGPYDRYSCQLCDHSDTYKLCKIDMEENATSNQKCCGRRKAFSVDKLLDNKRHEYSNTEHGMIHKKSTVSIMNTKNPLKVFERMKSRSTSIEDSDYKYRDGLWVDAGRIYSDPVSANSPYLTSPTHSYRSNETGSANSTGSGCNSYISPRSKTSAFSGLDRYVACREPCYKRYEGEGLTLRTNLNSYSQFKKEDGIMDEDICSCLQCDVNREFLRRGSRNYKLRGVIPNENVTPAVKRKPLSKRKALLGELELENNRNKELVTDPTKNFIRQSQNKNDDQRQNVSTVDLLEIPAGPNRSRAVANLLERRRVAELNSSFETLRVLVPTYGNEDRTLSKIKTLKYALTYIDHLMKLLSELRNNNDFDLERDFIKLCRKDPLIQKSHDHMKNNRKLF